jgi:hypothetical protein
VSLDQFRGYTVLGMVFVNFAGGYDHIPRTFGHHHVYCSYADTIMPGFLFCVGMAMRLTFVRRAASGGLAAAYRKAIKRNLGLIFVGCVVYHFTGGFKTWADVEKADFGSFLLASIKRTPFEALTHIGVTSLFVLPVIGQASWARALYALLASGLHVAASKAGYYEWNMKAPVGIDGGPLGFLTWSIPLLVGSIVVDRMTAPAADASRFSLSGFVLMAGAYLLSSLGAYAAEPLVHPDNVAVLRNTSDYWTMSQRAGSVSYTLFGAGFSLLLFAVFRAGADGFGLRWGYLDLFGKHALVAYVAHDLVMGMVKPFVPKDAPAWYVLAGFAIVLAALTLILRYFDRNKFAVRL